MTGTRNSRQSFLGSHAADLIPSVRVAILGLGGGGSHIVQQLAHIGFQHFVLCDPDHVEESNLNRLVGATGADEAASTLKGDVAARVIRGLHPRAQVEFHAQRWQDVAESLRHVDIIFGCLDGYAERNELEAFTRRFFIPLVDIGLDVRVASTGAPQMAGQVILSMPGYSCMHCMGFLNNVDLAEEAARYGAAGVRPQVVWANGMLASAAVGVAVDLLTGWTRRTRAPVYLEYDGNVNTLKSSIRLQYLPTAPCPHYPPEAAGLPKFDVLPRSDLTDHESS